MQTFKQNTYIIKSRHVIQVNTFPSRTFLSCPSKEPAAELKQLLNRSLICTVLIDEFPPIFWIFCKPFISEIEILRSFSVQWQVSSLKKLCKQQATSKGVFICSCDIHNFLARNRNFLKKILRKTKSGQAASKIKDPKFEKELTYLVPYIFAEKKDNQTFLPLQRYRRVNRAMTMWIATARPIITTQHTAILPTPLRLRHLMRTLIVYKRTDENNSSPEEPSAASILREYLPSKKKKQVSSEDTLTNFFISMAQTWGLFPYEIRSKLK